MTPPIIALISVFSALLLLIIVILVRAACFNPKREAETNPESISVNSEKAAADLSEMLRCKTVSDKVKENEDEAEFTKFKELLPALFPKVFEKCSYEEPSDRALLFRWEGKRHDAPTVLMSHYDVVSVEEEKWERPAFSGLIENGVLWGRGVIDTKGTLNGILQAAEQLIGDGFVPENDIYFAFAGDEEINGHGAQDIVALFKERGITPGIVVDEGGAVVSNVFPGVKTPCAMIGIAEKGMVNIEYSVSGGGGHASSPAPKTPIGRLSTACVKMEKNPFKLNIPEPTAKLLDTLGRRSSFALKIIFANLWLFRPLLDLIAKKSGGEFNALMRTTVAFTQMEGSKGMNVIPAEAHMISNHRIIPGETVDEVVSLVEKTVEGTGVKVRKIEGTNPSVVSRTDCEAWERVKRAVGETWQGVIVSPYLMVACSDSRHWGVLSDKVYRFSAMQLSKEERATIHGNNERLPVETVGKIVEFYIRLIKNS